MSKPEAALNETFFPVGNYDLSATLASGQAFRWRQIENAWEGVIAEHWVRLSQRPDGIEARTATAVTDWTWLRNYLQVDLDLDPILLSFPDDEPMRQAVLACRGLRLLRQEPWECLASFILSSTKQIVQIQQIIALLCERFGKPVIAPSPAFAFPTAERLAACAEADLRGCKMGFRAPNLLATAKLLAAGEVNLESLRTRTTTEARAELMELPGVGRKIADCVLLFAYGFQDAFPVDVWVLKALKELYFRKRRPSARKLREFADTHFGTNAGYAQQYLFHFMRTSASLRRRLRDKKISGAAPRRAK